MDWRLSKCSLNSNRYYHDNNKQKKLEIDKSRILRNLDLLTLLLKIQH